MRTSWQAQPTHRTSVRQAAVALCCVALLGGCTSVERFYDSQLSLDTPIDWWHQLQGGPIANERPPPPGITDPYPNLARVPATPTPTDAATRNGLLAQLASQRDSTRLLAAQDPVVFPPPNTPKPPTAAPTSRTPRATPAATSGAAPGAAPGVGTAPAPATDTAANNNDTSTMVLDAANAPAAPAPSAPPPPASDPNPPAGLAHSPGPPTASGPVQSGPIPTMPTAAPPLPNLRGLPIAVAAPVVTRVRASARFSFAPGSAVLPRSAEASLQTLAAKRAGGPIAVVAGGDARSSAPDAQGVALPLALRRTDAVIAALVAAGVPSASIRAEAVAPGREASARLVD